MTPLLVALLASATLPSYGGVSEAPVGVFAVDKILAEFFTGPANPFTAAAATEALSTIVGLLDTSSDSGHNKMVGAAVRAAVKSLGEALLATQVENAPPVQLVSQNLNISLEKRDVGAATASPFACPTVNGQETLARVPRAAVGSEDEIGAVMWTSAGDVHGADEVVNVSLVGPPTSFTLYTAQAEELEVKDSPEPVMLSLSLSPEAKTLAKKTNETLECRYFEEEMGEWSTKGCVTVDLGGKDNLGCHCGHLSDFIAVKIPTKFEGAITFANLDTVTEITLHCACTSGVRIRINKGIGEETDFTKLPVAIVDGGYSAWNESLPFHNADVWTFVDVFYAGRATRNPPTWLATNGTSGRVDMRAGQGTMNLLMDPS
jgi:hypothetical protein